MSERSHCFDGMLGREMVSTLPIQPRRKTAQELARMDVMERIKHLAAHPLTDEEKMEDLKREDRDHYYQTTGEVDAQDILDNHPPAGWGE